MKIEPIEYGSRNAWLRKPNRKIPLELPKLPRRVQWWPLCGALLAFGAPALYVGWHVWKWVGR